MRLAVCLYELVRDKRTAIKSATPVFQPATSADVERITTLLLDTLRASGYLSATSSASAKEKDKLRRMVRRLKLADADAELWLGMLRQILWKLQAGN